MTPVSRVGGEGPDEAEVVQVLHVEIPRTQVDRFEVQGVGEVVSQLEVLVNVLEAGLVAHRQRRRVEAVGMLVEVERHRGLARGRLQQGLVHRLAEPQQAHQECRPLQEEDTLVLT